MVTEEEIDNMGPKNDGNGPASARKRRQGGVAVEQMIPSPFIHRIGSGGPATPISQPDQPLEDSMEYGISSGLPTGDAQALEPASQPSNKAPPLWPPQGSPSGTKAAPVAVPSEKAANLLPSKRQNTARQNPIVAQAMAAVAENTEWLQNISSVPVYSPTAEEWADPIAYVRSIQAEAAKYGACVVKAPVAPAVPAALVLRDLRFTTRLQGMRDAPWGKSWSDGGKFYERGRRCSIAEYSRASDDFARKKLGLAAELPTATVEAKYWKERELRTSGRETFVEYGNDVEGSGFHPSDPLGATNWNLNVLPDMPGSALKWCSSTIPGVNTPMLYIGMLYASFAWHVEDHFMYSINYSHAGAPKVWYCIPAGGADRFEATAAATVYKEPCAAMEAEGASVEDRAAAVADALAGKTTVISPKVLAQHGVPVFRAVQEVGSYVITFPRSYHSGFSTGFNLGEAVNFTLSEWWPFGEHARQLYRRLKKAQILSHEQVLCDEAVALGQRLYGNSLDSVASTEGELGIDQPVAAAFVANLQQLHLLRKKIQDRGGTAVYACDPASAPDSAAMRAAVPCHQCGQLCYLASTVLDASQPSSDWRQLCLICAEEDSACGPKSLVFVKPCISAMESLAQRLETTLKTQPTAELSLPLAGCCEEARAATVVPEFTWDGLEAVAVHPPQLVSVGATPAAAVHAVDAVDAGASAGSAAAAEERPKKENGVASAKATAPTAAEAEPESMELPVGPSSEAIVGGDHVAIAGAGHQSALAAAEDGYNVQAAKSNSKKKAKKTEPLYPLAEVVSTDEVTLTTKDEPAQRRVLTIAATGEIVINGYDVVKAAHPPNSDISITRWLTRKVNTALKNNKANISMEDCLGFVQLGKNGKVPVVHPKGALQLLAGSVGQPELHSVFAAMFENVWGEEYAKERDAALAWSKAVIDKVLEEKEKLRVRMFKKEPMQAEDAAELVVIAPVAKAKKRSREAVEEAVEVAAAEAEPELALQAPPAPALAEIQAAEQQTTPQQKEAEAATAAAVAQSSIGDETAKPYSAIETDTDQAAEASDTGPTGPKKRRRKEKSSFITENPEDYLPVEPLDAESLHELPVREAIKVLISGLDLQHPDQAFNGISSDPLPESAKSNDKLRLYLLPGSNEVVVAAYHVVLHVKSNSLSASQVLRSWIRSIGHNHRAATGHVVCMAPMFYRCENWKNGKQPTFLLTLDQCIVIEQYALSKPAEQEAMAALIKSVWGPKMIEETAEKVSCGGFVSRTPLRKALKASLLDARDRALALGYGEDTDVEDAVAGVQALQSAAGKSVGSAAPEGLAGKGGAGAKKQQKGSGAVNKTAKQAAAAAAAVAAELAVIEELMPQAAMDDIVPRYDGNEDENIDIISRDTPWQQNGTQALSTAAAALPDTSAELANGGITDRPTRKRNAEAAQQPAVAPRVPPPPPSSPMQQQQEPEPRSLDKKEKPSPKKRASKPKKQLPAKMKVSAGALAAANAGLPPIHPSAGFVEAPKAVGSMSKGSSGSGADILPDLPFLDPSLVELIEQAALGQGSASVPSPGPKQPQQQGLQRNFLLPMDDPIDETSEASQIQQQRALFALRTHQMASTAAAAAAAPADASLEAAAPTASLQLPPNIQLQLQLAMIQQQQANPAMVLQCLPPLLPLGDADDNPLLVGLLPPKASSVQANPQIHRNVGSTAVSVSSGSSRAPLSAGDDLNAIVAAWRQRMSDGLGVNPDDLRRIFQGSNGSALGEDMNLDLLARAVPRATGATTAMAGINGAASLQQAVQINPGDISNTFSASAMALPANPLQRPSGAVERPPLPPTTTTIQQAPASVVLMRNQNEEQPAWGYGSH